MLYNNSIAVFTELQGGRLIQTVSLKLNNATLACTRGQLVFNIGAIDTEPRALRLEPEKSVNCSSNPTAGPQVVFLWC
jgi:hypothetical protein